MVEAEVNQLRVVSPPSLIVLLLSTVSSGSTVCGSLSRSRRCLALFVRDERGAGVLEGLATGDVVVVVMAVNHVPGSAGW